MQELQETLFEDPADVVARGEALLTALFEMGERGLVRSLLPLFDDKVDHQDLMWSMLHAVETLPGEEYSAELLAGLPGLWRASRDWSETIFLRAIRDPETLGALADHIPCAQEETRSTLRPLLELIRDQNPEDEEAASALLTRLEL